MKTIHSFLVGTGAVLFFLFFSCDVLRPFILSEQDEVELGNKFKAQILADTRTYPPFTGDERVKHFVDSLGQILADVQNDRKTLQFTFTLIDDDTMVNAFAIPGGHVFLYTGLIKAADNTAELAGVLAHEIAHITKYHGADRLVQGTFVGYVNDILFGNDSSAANAIAVILENMTFMQLSQKDEYEADSCAVAYTTKAGINPIGMKQFLTTLKNLYGDTPKIFEPFSSHPPLSERISRVQAIINKTPNAPSGTEQLFRSEFQVIKGLL